MFDGNLLSILVGAMLGIAYGAASLWMVRRAGSRPARSFMVMVLGGMLLRLAVASIAILLILLFLPVDPLILTLTFLGFFAVAIAAEIRYLHRTAGLQSSAHQTPA